MVCRIRRADKDDMPHIMQMIQELADFEKMSEGPKITVEDLIRDGGFDDTTKPPLFYCTIAEASVEGTLTPIGYTLSFFSYSMWKGKTLFLEDLYVRPSHRLQGVGRQLFVTAMRTCRRFSCKALSFHVLAWNPAKAFYEKFNAINWTERSGQQFFRLEEHVIDELLGGASAGTSE